MALELQNDQLVFTFPQVHEHARLSVEFQRTLRIPDDDKTYPLPPGLGRFPLKHVEDYESRVPSHWREHGGVFLPLYQSEALWLRFTPHQPHDRNHAYPFIVKVGTGKKSALTGKEWKKGIHKGDYCVVPEQPWLDGYVIEEGVIAQFVAVPLGMGITVEEQLGGDGIGGIQLEVFPMKADCFDRRWPKRPKRRRHRRMLRSAGMTKGGPPGTYTSFSLESTMGAPGAAGEGMSVNYCCDASLSDDRAVPCAAEVEVSEMGLGAGGRMKQQVFEDPYGKDEWSRKVDGTRRCFVHLANSMAWQNVTGEKPPETPVTAATYERYGMPWFDFYSDDLQAKKGAKKLKGVKTVKDAAKDKGLKGILPENESVQPKHVLPIKQVQNGKW